LRSLKERILDIEYQSRVSDVEKILVQTAIEFGFNEGLDVWVAFG